MWTPLVDRTVLKDSGPGRGRLAQWPRTGPRRREIAPSDAPALWNFAPGARQMRLVRPARLSAPAAPWLHVSQALSSVVALSTPHSHTAAPRAAARAQENSGRQWETVLLYGRTAMLNCQATQEPSSPPSPLGPSHLAGGQGRCRAPGMGEIWQCRPARPGLGSAPGDVRCTCTL